MTEKEFHKLIHRRLSQISIGPSAIRSQGSGGLIKILRNHFEEMSLEEFYQCLSSESEYAGFLDRNTNLLVNKFPENGKSWGAARKGLNLFLREIVYSKYFSDYFSFPKEYTELNSFLKFMEVPLDREVANGLIQDSKGILPKWKTIKWLTPEKSKVFQNQAKIIADNEKIARVNLDLKYWRKAKDEPAYNSQ